MFRGAAARLARAGRTQVMDALGDARFVGDPGQGGRPQSNPSRWSCRRGARRRSGRLGAHPVGREGALAPSAAHGLRAW